jgi:glycosyltransferase involved in cell wall biosynthesis
LEVLVVDDASTDDGPNLVAALAAEHPGKLKLLRHSDHANHGIAASRNLAIRNAKGAWIGFVDQDDQWSPRKIERQMEVIGRYPEVGIVYAKSSFMNQNGIEVPLAGLHMSGGRGTPGEPRNIFRELIKENIIPTCTTLVRRDCIDRVGLLDEGPRFEYEDWIVFSKMAYFYSAIFIPEILSRYRVHDNNYSAYLFRTGQLYHAEEHYTISLFSFLFDNDVRSREKLRALLRRRIRFFFLRARSWGVTSEVLRQHADRFLEAFPDDERSIRAAARVAMLLHPGIAASIRRLRRSIVRV